MKNITILLTILALCTATLAKADDVLIPTTEEHPFDLTLGTFEGSGMRINGSNEIENVRNGYKATFTLENIEDADFYVLSFKAGTPRSDAAFHITLTAQGGSVVCEEYLALTNNGTWNANYNYVLKTGQMKKGKYTLIFDFISEGNNYVANLTDIAFLKPMKLKPGDEVPIVNPEFDEGKSGWKSNPWNASLGVNDMFGNNSGSLYVNGGPMSLSQTVMALPDGVYLLMASAYDHAYDWNGTDVLQSYLFINDSYQPMKNAFDDAVGYRNIYRIYDGQSKNDYYRRTQDARYVPTAGHKWNQCLAMAEGLYVNAVAATITNGKADIGWMSDGSSRKQIVCDHFRFIYLSSDISLSAEARATLASEYVTNAYKARLDSQIAIVKALLNNGKPHAPQAIAEANSVINTSVSNLKSDNEIIDAMLHAEHTAQRLKWPYYDITLNSPGTLSDRITAYGIGVNDTIALKINGTPGDADFATLKTLKNLKELDLSETTITDLPYSQFQGSQNLLTWLTLPRQLETIGYKAFWDCISLRDMVLPATLRSIGSQAFHNCQSLDCAVIPDNVTLDHSIYSGSSVRSISFPPSLKEVPRWLCYECPDLVDIHFNGQIDIKERAFARCNALRSVALPEGMETLDASFIECNELASATLPSTLIYLNVPFNACKKLKDVTIMAACPPYGGIFETLTASTQMEGVTVHVPRLSEDAYRNSLFEWSDAIIEPVDILPQTITMNNSYTLNVPDGLPANYKPDVDLRMMVGYPNAGATEVTSLVTKGSLTVKGSSMLSTAHYRQLYSPYAARSSRFHKPEWRASVYTSLVNNGQMRADEVTINLQLYKNFWDFITFPFDVRVGDIICADGPMPLIIYGYDAKKRAEGTGQAWVLMTADSTLHAGKGYIWQTSIPNNEKRSYPYNTFHVNALQNANKPLFFLNNDVEVTLEKHNAEFAQNRSWNFIGNPYPCFFDIRAMETTAPIIVWEFNRNTGGNYQAISTMDDDYILYPGQAFFIQCPLDNDKLLFHKEGRQHDMELQYQASNSQVRVAAATHPRQVFNLCLTTEQDGETLTVDRTRFVINEAATLDYEQARDAAKFPAMSADAAEIYIIRDGIRYAIDERPLADGIVKLGLNVPTAGSYTIALSVPAGSADGEVTLIDRTTGIEVALGEDGYTFQAESGTYNDRFVIRLNTATAVECIETESQLKVKGQLYDIQGRPVSNPQQGIYVRDNKKVIIK